MDDSRDEGRVAANEEFELAKVKLKFIIARNENIPLDKVDLWIEQFLLMKGREGVINYGETS